LKFKRESSHQLARSPELNFERSFEAKSCKTTPFHLFLFNTHVCLISWSVKKLSFSPSLLATSGPYIRTMPKFTLTIQRQWLVKHNIQVLPQISLLARCASANFILFPKVKEHLADITLTKATFKSTWHGLTGPSPPNS
jgi:hypothetical protein